MDSFFTLLSLPDGRLFAVDGQALTQMAFILFFMVIFAIILSALLYKPVLKVLQRRKAHIQKEMESAEKIKSKALTLKAEYEHVIKATDQEKYEILDAARKAAAEQSKLQLAEARSKANEERNRARAEIEAERERAENEMEQAIVEVSSLIITKVLNRSMDADMGKHLFNETIAEWGGAS